MSRHSSRRIVFYESRRLNTLRVMAKPLANGGVSEYLAVVARDCPRCNTAGKMVSGLQLICDSSSPSQTLDLKPDADTDRMPWANQVGPDFSGDIDGSDRGTIFGFASRGARVGRRSHRGRWQRTHACARGGCEVAGDERRGVFRWRNHQDRFGLPKR